MRVVKVISDKDNLCKYCSLDFATCPKANYIRFGSGKGNDNVIQCSEFMLKAQYHNFPIEGMPELGVIKCADNTIRYNVNEVNNEI